MKTFDKDSLFVGSEPEVIGYGVSWNPEVVLASPVSEEIWEVRRIGHLSHGKFKPVKSERESRVESHFPNGKWREVTEEERNEIVFGLFGKEVAHGLQGILYSERKGIPSKSDANPPS